MFKWQIPMFMKLRVSFACVLIAFTTLAQKKTDSLTIKLDGIFSNYNNKSGPGVAAGIVQNGKTIFKKGYGMANLEYDIPITSASIFDIASVSKQFAGLAISTLVQQGKISLSDDIHKYVPEVPDFGQTITINHLVHHTSGLRDWPEGLNVAGWRWNEDFSFDDIMRMIKHQKDLDFVPGSKYSYSNTGYNLLAVTVERVTGKSFREWTDENIFTPLQMLNSHFLDEESKIVKNMAYSYHKENDVYHKNMTGLTALGSSSLFTNVDDLCKWVLHFDARVTAKDPVYLRMLETVPLNNGEKNSYAFGLGFGEMSGLRTIAHTGGWAGYRTVILNFPDEKLSIILLGNDASFNSYGAATEVAKVILGTKLKSNNNTTTDKIKEQPTIALNTEIARKQEGTYKLGDGWYVTLTLENGVLMTQANGEPKFTTSPKSDSTIWIDAYNASMTFVKSKDGSINSLKYKGIVAPRIIPFKPDLSNLDHYSGTYYSEEFETIYKIDYVNKKLMLHHMRLGDFELSPDIVLGGAFNCGMGRMEFLTENGKVTGFKLSRGRVKNLKFIKL
jgi:CubicO group peptidase (beta-lactamase class C family)